MESCIYEGTIRHRRFKPVENAFEYRLFLMYIDFEELPTLFTGSPFWSHNKPNVAYFRRGDHFGDPRIPLHETVRTLVGEKLGRRPEGPVRMLAHLRYFGHCFNPVSFFYCYDPGGKEVEAIVAEIHNTPWGEIYSYVFGKSQNEHPSKDWKRFRFPKSFHVSPFMGMNLSYDWRFKIPGDTVGAHFINMENGATFFDATLSLHRREITPTSLNRVLIAYPLMTLKVITVIYWQAAKLLSKGAPFYDHPESKGTSPRSEG